MRFPLFLTMLAATLVALVPVASAASPAARATSACGISGKERKLGATYVTSVTATRVNCATALDVVRAFHRCRHRDGAAGRCPSVSGYRCSERREAISTQYDSRATCTRGARKVVMTYTQNT